MIVALTNIIRAIPREAVLVQFSTTKERKRVVLQTYESLDGR
jgi:hypothetical protein